MITSIEIAKLLMAQKKKKKLQKEFSFDGGLMNLGVVKKEKKKS